jgi:hypothetical protein
VFSTFTVFTSTTLPVEISQFSGKKRDNHAQLTWTTAAEKDNKGFDIEKNTEGGQFKSIGFVKSRGDANAATDYAFLDVNFTETAYYRLKQTDDDGHETYSKIITLENDAKKGQISVFPNPILRGSTLNIQAIGIKNLEDVKVEIYATNGQLVQRQKGIAPLQTDDWENGIYVVKIVNDLDVTTLRVVKN